MGRQRRTNLAVLPPAGPLDMRADRCHITSQDGFRLTVPGTVEEGP
jgi:hypothetical protein